MSPTPKHKISSGNARVLGDLMGNKELLSPSIFLEIYSPLLPAGSTASVHAASRAVEPLYAGGPWLARPGPGPASSFAAQTCHSTLHLSHTPSSPSNFAFVQLIPLDDLLEYIAHLHSL